MVNSNNFRFLKSIDSYLYSLAIEAEKQMFIDNDTSMYKLRKMLENVVQNIFDFEGISKLLTKNLYKNIDFLHKNNYVSDNLFALLEEVRKNGNEFVHKHDIDLKRNNNLVMKSVKNMYLITGYYCKKYINNQIYIESFKDYYVDKTRRFIITEKYNDLTNYQNEFLNISLIFLSDRLATHIIRDKIAFGTIKELGYISFDEFFEYYMELLRLLIVEDEANMKLILQLKGIVKYIVSSSDGENINYYIARILYKDIFEDYKN